MVYCILNVLDLSHFDKILKETTYSRHLKRNLHVA